MINTIKLEIKRIDNQDTDFIKLVAALDKELAIRDGEDHEFYDQFNKLDDIKFAVVMYLKNEPIGCGAIKQLDHISMEVKRMFVLEDHRGEGYASKILEHLLNWSKELGFNKLMLETGINQPEAISLYQKNGFERVENYGQYAGLDTSLCFEKYL